MPKLSGTSKDIGLRLNWACLFFHLDSPLVPFKIYISRYADKPRFFIGLGSLPPAKMSDSEVTRGIQSIGVYRSTANSSTGLLRCSSCLMWLLLQKVLFLLLLHGTTEEFQLTREAAIFEVKATANS